MNENLLKRIKNQLNAKFYMMNDAWLRDCIKYFVKDKTLREMTDRHILEFVEGQWQLSDLREVNNENGCLPRNLIQQVHTVLTGTYILQVNKMYDIANSKYKQLCEIRKINSENLIVAEEERQAEWEPKARRMIQLCLTDGVQDITAIEYKPLKQMTNMLLPGYKVMITGPVSCRRGVILLEDGKYKEIGGEVESLLQSNALENVLARALGEPENPDPYNDNGLLRTVNQNVQNDNLNSNDTLLFDDDFEEIVDLEAVTAIERQNQEAETIQNCIGSNENQTREINEITEDFLEDIDFDPLENWPNDSPMRPVHPTSRVEIEKFGEKDDIMIVEETSISAHDSRNKQPPSTSSFRNEYASEFLDNDFDFDDCEIMVRTEKSRSQQDENLSKNETKAYSSPLMPKSKLTNHNTLKKVKTNISIAGLTKQNEKSVASVPSTAQPTKNTETINVLSDILSEPIIGRVRKIVRAKVKNHSALKKQGKYWAVTALIADHTSSIEVCFDSEILEKYIGFSVQEFSQKKKLAKLDSQVNNELRLNLRKAQRQIENLNALLELELAQDKVPKIVNIM
ncbi:recQ-mediated genome instability protein 1-like isoform X1 [Formica exsecta]|uniref:recQ-mediated genome instability protein 1-like isoform X1 n=1 Tax=Formica exsecta TaxID=72781 RepID=UPI001143A4AF|nr:recQ-mediated genome instability protein 1-like isoform X1 [Formica exsecta]